MIPTGSFIKVAAGLTSCRSDLRSVTVYKQQLPVVLLSIKGSTVWSTSQQRCYRPTLRATMARHAHRASQLATPPIEARPAYFSHATMETCPFCWTKLADLAPQESQHQLPHDTWKYCCIPSPSQLLQVCRSHACRWDTSTYKLLTSFLPVVRQRPLKELPHQVQWPASFSAEAAQAKAIRTSSVTQAGNADYRFTFTLKLACARLQK